jgi:hypothetical protein
MPEHVRETRPPEPPEVSPRIEAPDGTAEKPHRDSSPGRQQSAWQDARDAAQSEYAKAMGDEPRQTAADSSAANRLGSDDAEVPRWSSDALTPTGKRDTTYGRELLAESDGAYHYAGDRIETFRDERGRLHDKTGAYTKDDNAPATKDIQARAQPDIASIRTYSADGDSPADAAVRDCVHARRQVAEARDDLWNERLAPIADTLEAQGIHVNAVTLSDNRNDELIRESLPHLTRADRLVLFTEGRQYAEMTDQLGRASEQLGKAGGALVAEREFSSARLLTGGDGDRGTPHNTDRVLYHDEASGTLIAMEEKGVGGRLTSRLVEDPARPDGEKVRAEQCSPEYVRHMLQHDTKLTAALLSDQELRARIQHTVNGAEPGTVRTVLISTSATGVVTATDYILDETRLGRATITLAGSIENPRTGEA